MTSKVIDISAWQGVVSVDTFKNMKSYIPGVIIRCSYTSQKSFSLHEDKCFKQNIANAYKAGMKIGVYHYSQAVSESEAIKEARFVLEILHMHKGKITLGTAIDWEFGGRLNSYVAEKMGKQRCKQICDAFCRTIKQAGFDAMVYANLSTLNGYIASDIYKVCKIWVAQYAPKCQYKHPMYMWQYTSGGKVDGIKGRVDMNYLYGDTIKPKKEAKYTGTLPVLPKRGWFTSGDKGQQVVLLQKFLNWYFGYKKLAEDGEVGRQTMDAVRGYEGIEKLKPIDGLFGRKCLARASEVER